MATPSYTDGESFMRDALRLPIRAQIYRIKNSSAFARTCAICALNFG